MNVLSVLDLEINNTLHLAETVKSNKSNIINCRK